MAPNQRTENQPPTTEAAHGPIEGTPEPAVALAATIDLHLEAYGEPDAARRGELIARVWDRQGRLIDPPLEGEGHDGIADMAGTVQTMFPGHTFRRTSAIDEHHGTARYEWELLDPAGTAVLAGTDIAELATDGRLQRVTGFFGPLEPIAR